MTELVRKKVFVNGAEIIKEIIDWDGVIEY